MAPALKQKKSEAVLNIFIVMSECLIVKETNKKLKKLKSLRVYEWIIILVRITQTNLLPWAELFVAD